MDIEIEEEKKHRGIFAMHSRCYDTSNVVAAIVCHSCKYIYAGYTKEVFDSSYNPGRLFPITPLCIDGEPYQFKNPLINCTVCSEKLSVVKDAAYRAIKKTYEQKKTHMNNSGA